MPVRLRSAVPISMCIVRCIPPCTPCLCSSMERAADSYPAGCRFDSCQGHQVSGSSYNGYYIWLLTSEIRVRIPADPPYEMQALSSRKTVAKKNRRPLWNLCRRNKSLSMVTISRAADRKSMARWSPTILTALVEDTKTCWR